MGKTSPICEVIALLAVRILASTGKAVKDIEAPVNKINGSKAIGGSCVFMCVASYIYCEDRKSVV